MRSIVLAAALITSTAPAAAAGNDFDPITGTCADLMVENKLARGFNVATTATFLMGMVNGMRRAGGHELISMQHPFAQEVFKVLPKFCDANPDAPLAAFYDQALPRN